MGVNVHIDGIDEEIARAVAERILDELEGRLAHALQQSEGAPSQAPSDGIEIMGICPFDLYPVAFVSERWGVSKDYVRKLPAEDLPRAPWHGGEIRYRGLDILHYEGVAIKHLLPPNVHLLRPDAAEDSSSPPPERRRPAARSNSRPYNQSLPKL